MSAGESYGDITGTTARLPIPDQALRLFRQRCPDSGLDNAEVMDLIEAVAAPIVAAELRRIVQKAREDMWEGLLGLERRADQLDTAAQETEP